jgi:hypothetical protein
MPIRVMIVLIIGLCSISATTSVDAQYVSLCQPLSIAARARGCTLVGASQCEVRTQRSLGTFPDRIAACAAACSDGRNRFECPAGTIGCPACDLANLPTTPRPPR